MLHVSELVNSSNFVLRPSFLLELTFVCLWFRSEEVQAMMEKLKQEEEKLKKAENTIAVMTMLKEGTVPETVSTAGEHWLVQQWCKHMFYQRTMKFALFVLPLIFRCR